MKKLYILLLVFVIIISSYLWLNYIWKGSYENWAWETFIFQSKESIINVTSDFWSRNSALKVSYIDYEINENKKEIYVWLYIKYYSWWLSFIESKDNIELKNHWKYKIYYKNKDWSLDFIKEIEYK